MSSPRRRPPAISAEHGFTLVEVLVAVLVLSVGVIGSLTLFDASRRAATRSEMRATATAVARGEIERIEALPWTSVALASNPAVNSGAGPTDPTYYISSGPCQGSSNPPVTMPYSCYRWNWNDSASAEPLVVSAGTTDPNPNPSQWSDVISVSNSSVRVSGWVYRYITWVNDPQCTATACGGTNDYKRITVVVTSTSLSKPLVMTTLLANPTGGTQDPLTLPSVKCLDAGSLVPCDD